MLEVLTKSQHLGEQLKQELASEQLSLGQRFYSIPEVSERYRVSPATAYKVVSRLVRDGYLRSHRGKGYFVERKPASNTIHRLFQTPPVRTRTLLLLNDFSDTTPPAHVLAGIQDACNEANFRFEVVAMSAPNIVELAEHDDVAGLILVMDRDSMPMRQIRKPKICVGHWSNPDDGVISYIGDAEQAAVDLVRHLCGLGHTRIALLGPRADLRLTDANCAQFIAGLRRGFQIYGLSWDDQLNDIHQDQNEDAGVEQFARTFRDRQITAAFVPVWSTVLKLVRRLRQDGLSVPKDLSVVTYGDDPLSPHIQPAMTSFELFIRDIAKQAAMAIVEHDRDGKPLPKTRFVTFPVELLVRKSTAMR